MDPHSGSPPQRLLVEDFQLQNQEADCEHHAEARH